MASRYAVDDSEWDEVKILNGYAMFLGYLLMGVRGLGVLVATWTTVVLLGGFVSDLQSKDFWCLTGITLVQTAGVFNFLLKEKLSDMSRSWWGLLSSVFASAGLLELERSSRIRRIVGVIFLVLQGLVIVFIICPLGVLYMLGLYISAGVSLWRLIEHDFGNAGGANKKPALLVLYCLAVAQGMLFGYYKTIQALGARNRLAKFVAKVGEVDEELVVVYLEETVAGCQKDPSFATGRNLVTYAVDLMMEAKSDEGFIAGIRALGCNIKEGGWGQRVLAKQLLTRSDSWSHMLQRLLETVGPRSPYSREVREHAARILALVARAIRLQQVPGVIECISSELYTSAEESNKHDSQLHCIRPMYGDNSYERVELLEEYERDYLKYSRKSSGYPDSSSSNWLVQCLPCKRKKMKNIRGKSKNTVDGFDGLLKEAVNIIHKLAIDKGNRRIMSKDTVLQHKITMAPLKLHKDNHDACSESQDSELQVLEKCWVLTEWLMDTAVKETKSQGQILVEVQPAAPLLGGGAGGGSGETIEDAAEGAEEGLLISMAGPALGNAIINSVKSTVKSIFDCLDCRATQKKQGIQILLHLYLDMSFIMDSESRKRRLTWILLLISQSHDDSYHWMVSGFTDRNKKMPDFSSIKNLAGEKLWDMLREKHELPSEESESKSIRLVVRDITNAFSGDDTDISVRTHAAIIMEGLCVCYSYRSSTDISEEAMEILVGVIPKVVEEILIHCASTREERQAQPADLEKGVVSQDDNADNERLRKALVSLCRDGYMESFYLRDEFKETATKICGKQGKSREYFESLLV